MWCEGSGGGGGVEGFHVLVSHAVYAASSGARRLGSGVPELDL